MGHLPWLCIQGLVVQQRASVQAPPVGEQMRLNTVPIAQPDASPLVAKTQGVSKMTAC